MPVAAVVSALSSATYKFVVSIGGQVVNPKIPLNGDGVQAFTYTLAGESTTGECRFTIEDPDSSFTLAFGADVTISDFIRGYESRLWGGTLVEANVRPRGSNAGRLIDCTAVSYDAWLDWKYITRFVSKKDSSKKVSYINSDRGLIFAIAKELGGQQPIVLDSTYVSQTNTSMPNIELIGVTVREALQQIADAATTNLNNDTNRYFYVDASKNLHYYKDKESLVAPYFVTDDFYTRRVLATSGLVSFWRLTDKSGTSALDLKSYANGTYTGGYTLNVTGGITNEPYLTAASFNGSTGYVTASGAALHPGDTFTIELWYNRTTAGSVQTLWSSGLNDVEIGFTATNQIVVYKEGVGNNFVSTATTFGDLSTWHHLAVRRTPGNTNVYLDGVEVPGSVTAQTFVAAAGAVNIGRRLSSTDRYFNGAIAGAAIYSTDIGAFEIMRHATIGDGVNPIDLQIQLTAYDGRERVYVAGRNAEASGWVKSQAGWKSTTFGRALYGPANAAASRDGFIDRPEVESGTKAQNIGSAWLRRHNDPRATATFSVTGYDGWKPGQLLYIYNKALDCITKDANGFAADDGRGVPFEITSVTADASMGNGVITYSITAGPRGLRGSKVLFRNTRD